MKSRGPSKHDFYEADLYGEIWLSEKDGSPVPAQRIFDILPGLAVVLVAGLAANSLAGSYGMPAVLAGLLIGFSLNFVSSDRRVLPGLSLCSTTLLRWGIVFLGTQITLAQVADLGAVSLIALLVIMAVVMGAAILASRLAGQGSLVGLLAGGATAICGASAALAIYAMIGKERLPHYRFTFTLVGITLASATALMVYPILAGVLEFSDRQAGFLMGAAIHDVAQALGAGYALSPEAGETATIVKLARVAMLAPIVAIIGLAIGSPTPGKADRSPVLAALRLPWFIFAFFAVVLVNSLITFPDVVREWGLVASKGLLLLAIIATAMSSRLDALLREGWRGLISVLAATLVSFLMSVAYAWYFLG